MASKLELEDIQGFLRHGYPYFDSAAYCLFRIDDAAGAKRWLRRLRSDEERWIDKAALIALQISGEDCGVALAFTATGLRKLGLDDEVMSTFVSEFREGMHADYRARLLGDEGRNHPDEWKWGADDDVDGLLIVFAGYPLDEFLQRQETVDALAGLAPAQAYETLVSSWLNDRVAEILGLDGRPEIVRRLNARLNVEQGSGVSREPFGFADGLSQPYIEGLTRKDKPVGVRPIKAGEFVLGYLNEIDRYPASPSVAADARAKQSKLRNLATGGRADFGRNGTFLVMRELKQDVQAFNEVIAGDEWTAALLVGRFRNGAPLLGYEVDQPAMKQQELEARNNFGYHREDRHGFRCPIGAHIRRANPRDSLAAGLGIAPEQAQKLVDQHRILRRGRAYRQEDGTQGLVFICLNTNIERQFEFVQGSWLMHPEFGGLRGETDPLLGYAPDDGQRSMTLQRPLLNQRLDGLRRFVTVRGGAYFFLPGLRALDYLSRV